MTSRAIFQSEFRVRELGRAVGFYKSVFDWKIFKAAEDNALVDTGAMPLISLLQTTNPRFPIGVVSNLIVEDCEKEGVRAAALGGRVTVTKSEVLGTGAYVCVIDPWGVEVCFWQPYKDAHPTPEGSGKNPIAFLEIVTPNLPVAIEYYSQLMGWSFWNIVFRNEFSMAEGCGLKRGVGLSASTDGTAGSINYIEVENLEETAAKIQAAGGTVTTQPTEFPGEGRYLLFTDLDGIRLGALEAMNS